MPVSDQTLRTKILEQCQKDLGVKFNLETVDGLTIQARVTSAVSSGTGPDIISSINNWAPLYGESVIDVSDVRVIPFSPASRNGVLAIRSKVYSRQIALITGLSNGNRHIRWR